MVVQHRGSLNLFICLVTILFSRCIFLWNKTCKLFDVCQTLKMRNCGEEELREAACYNDVDAATKLLEAGIDVNSQHAINGRTALHWAVIRQHRSMVELLLANGADSSLKDNKGSVPADWASLELQKVLGITMDCNETQSSEDLCITPSYLAHPPLNYTVNLDNIKNRNLTENIPASRPNKRDSSNLENEELVLKVRAADSNDSDFIEIELPLSDLTYSNLLNTCSEELGIEANRIVRIRKLPNTIVRRDKDVTRLNQFQELEVLIGSNKC